MSPKKGRPLSANPRDIRVDIRLSKEELQRLDYCCRVKEKKRSVIVRECVDVLFEKIRHDQTQETKQE